MGIGIYEEVTDYYLKLHFKFAWWAPITLYDHLLNTTIINTTMDRFKCILK